jgi:molecular chaperone DnaJ
MAKDYYDILGVDKSASQAEIKKAFRKRAHKFHPDKKDGNEDKFKEVNEAYQVLGDEQKRAQYDQYGATFDQQGGFGGGGNWEDFMRAARGQQQGGGFQFNFGGMDMGDIFGDMFGFGGGGGGRRQVRGQDIQVDVAISLKEAVEGKEHTVTLKKHQACKTCDASGAKPGTSKETCTTCSGRGQVQRVQRTILGAMQTLAQCPDCHGAGSIAKEKCPDCLGTGHVNASTSMKVNIPAGIDHGQSIRITGGGEHPGAHGVAGDLYVRVHIDDMMGFSRDGYDLAKDMHISFAQAALGDTITIETIDGDKQLVIPAGTQSHQKFRMKGYGVPVLQRSSRGDLYIRVIVDVPKKLSKKAKQALEAFDDLC